MYKGKVLKDKNMSTHFVKEISQIIKSGKQPDSGTYIP